MLKLSVLLVILVIGAASSKVPIVNISILETFFDNQELWPTQKDHITGDPTTSAILDVILQIDAALQDYGIFIATGFPNRGSLFHSSIKASQALFNLSTTDKTDVALHILKTNESEDVSDDFGRGYLGLGTESGLSEFFEPKEGFSYGMPAQMKTNDLQSPNKWPVSLHGEDRRVLEDLFLHQAKVSNVITKAISTACTIYDVHDNAASSSSPSFDLFKASTDGASISLMRMFHYLSEGTLTTQRRGSSNGGDDSKTCDINSRNSNGDKNSNRNSDNNSNSSSHLSSNAISNTTSTREGNKMKRVLMTWWSKMAQLCSRVFKNINGVFQPNSKTSKTLIGSSPHTDWGMLTLILEDDVGGLQFLWKEKDGEKNADSGNESDGGKRHSKFSEEWVSVPHVPGGLVVNGGDYLSLVTHNRYKSPVHRVQVPKEKDRFSFVFFYYPSYDTSLYLQDLQSESKSKSINYNTLTSVADLDMRKRKTDDSLSNDGEEERLLFGDYIMKKWRGVYRA